jgi:hypothetical protein
MENIGFPPWYTIDNTDIEQRENKADLFKAGVGFSNVGISNAFKTL